MNESDGDLEIAIRGERIALLPERAMLWIKHRTLLIADPHFGKAATFRAGGIPVPGGTTGNTITRINSLVSRTSATRLVFLGDLLHAKEGRSTGLFDEIATWRTENAALEIILVRGNHDKRAGDPPGELNIECVDAPAVMLPFVLAHYPGSHPNGYVFAGHVHPGVRLYGSGGLRERLPCFVFGPDHAILPAFGDFTGFAPFDPDEGTDVYAVAGDAIIALGPRRRTPPAG